MVQPYRQPFIIHNNQLKFILYSTYNLLLPPKMSIKNQTHWLQSRKKKILLVGILKSCGTIGSVLLVAHCGAGASTQPRGSGSLSVHKSRGLLVFQIGFLRFFSSQ